MKNIIKLKGVEAGKVGLIIGGGCSVNDFDFSMLPEDVVRISVNWSFVETRIDYIIHSDGFFAEQVEKGIYKVPSNVEIISYEKFAFSGTDYYFNFNDIAIGFHSGFYALQIAQIMGFESIYLLGYDYKSDCGKLHYYEGNGVVNITEKEKALYNTELNKGLWIKDFKRAEWGTPIFNLNPDSALKRFEHKKLIQGVN